MKVSSGLGHGTMAEMAEQQMRLWALGLELRERVEHEHAAESRQPVVHPFVCISRETGAGGAEIARLVAEDLNWQLLDRELLHHIAETGNLSEFMLGYVDESRWNWLRDSFDWSVGERSVNHSGYVLRLGRVLMTAISHSSAVIVGRGANFLLPADKGLTVRVIAPLDLRIQRISQERHCSRDEARKHIETTDADRDAFVRQLLHRDPADPHSYDLVININHLEPRRAADLIVAECHQRFDSVANQELCEA